MLILGDDEFQKEIWMVKDLKEKTQVEVSCDGLEQSLRSFLAKGETVC